MARSEVNAPDYHEENRLYQRDKYREGRKSMAVDMSGGTIVPAEAQQSASPGIMERIEEHPIAALFIALVVAVAIGFLISKVRGTSSSSTTTTNAPGTSQGLPTTDAQGRPVYYVPTSNTFLDYNNIQDSYNPNNAVATTTTSTVNTTNNSDVDTGQYYHPPIVNPTVGNMGVRPLIPNGSYHGPSYSHLAPNTYYTYGGVRYLLQARGGGELWGQSPWGAWVKLYGPSHEYAQGWQAQAAPAFPPGSPQNTYGLQ